MRTVGEVLRNERLERKLALSEVEGATKIKREFLEAIEKNDFQKISSQTVARGFIKNYAEFLGLPSKSVLAIFRRDFRPAQKGKIIPQGMVEPINKAGLGWNPKMTLIVIVIIFSLGLLSYLGYQYFSLIQNPSLEIISPKEGEKFSGSTLEVVGKTHPDSLVTVNGNLVFLSPNGEFRYQLTLFPGENKVIIEVKSKLGRKTKVERTTFRLDK